MNIIEFREKVYQRIITQYIKDVRKTKLVWEDYLFIPCILISSLIFILSFSFYTNTNTSLNFFLSVSMLFSFVFAGAGYVFLLSEIKTIINFKKQSDIFWGTSLLSIPALDDSEMKKYLLQDDIWHCKHAYTTEQIESLIDFTPKEIEDMKLISFNKEQKDFILNSVKKGIKLNFYSLMNLVHISDESINQQKILAKQNINNNQTILKAIGYDLVHEQIMPVNQKVKYLL